MPQSGIIIVITFVTTNYNADHRSVRCKFGYREEGLHHLLGRDLPVPLNVPEAECADGRRDRLRET